MYLKPAPGLQVPDVNRGGLLALEGREVEPSTYWQRRIDAGDVVVVDPAPTTSPAKPSGTPAAAKD